MKNKSFQVILTFFQYVCGYDVHVTAELLSALSGQLSEDDATILSDFVRDLGSLGAESSLTALRLDWFRLQVLASSIHSSPKEPTQGIIS